MSNSQSVESIKQRLKLIADEQKKSFNQVLHELLLERAVARLVEDPVLAKGLVFKGGYVSLRCYGSSRMTIDLDAAVYGLPIEVATNRAMTAMNAGLDDAAWYSFEQRVDLATQSEYGGVRLQFRSGLVPAPKNLSKAIVIKIDFGVGDPITPGPLMNTLQSFVWDHPLAWSVYPIETIVSEKLHALIFHGPANSRSKDVFDLFYYIDQVDSLILRRALERTFDYRGTDLPESISMAIRDTETVILKKGWKAAVRNIFPEPDFENCYRHVYESLSKMGL